MEKKLNNPWVPNDYKPEIVLEYDKDYKTITIVDTVKKVGDADDDFIIEKKVVEELRPIQEVIDADAESVGVYNIIKQVMRTGDMSLLPVDKGECNVDMVGAPENLMELDQLGAQAAQKFAGLDPELTKGLDMKNFVETLTQEQFNAFIDAVAARAAGKVENKDE